MHYIVFGQKTQRWQREAVPYIAHSQLTFAPSQPEAASFVLTERYVSASHAARGVGYAAPVIPVFAFVYCMIVGDVQEETTRFAAEACAAGTPPEVRSLVNVLPELWLAVVERGDSSTGTG